MKKLLIKTPYTRDGRTLVYDENRQPIFKESLVEDTPFVRKQFESLNSSTPEHLRHELVEVDVPVAKPAVLSVDPTNMSAATSDGGKSKKKAVSGDLI